MSLSPVVSRMREFITLANWKDNTQTNDYNITWNIMSSSRRHREVLWKFREVKISSFGEEDKYDK